MPVPPKVTRDELALMLRQGMTHDEIAAAVGLTRSGVVQAVRRYGLAKPRLSHKWAIPWVIADEHRNFKVHLYLQRLSAAAQGKEIFRDDLNTAFNWAQGLVDAGLDIDYRRDMPPNDESFVGGFYVRKAIPSKWHLKKVLERARAGVTRH